MRRALAASVALLALVLTLASEARGASARIAALQVGLRAHGFDPGPIDGIRGPATIAALAAFQRARELQATGRLDEATRGALGSRGRPLLGQRELSLGAIGWDVAVLEFRLRRVGLPARAIDGRFTSATAAALRRFQRRHGLAADGIAGPLTYRVLARRGRAMVHVVRPGESFFSIAARYRVSPWQLARENQLSLTRVIVPGQRLLLPRGARIRSTASSGLRAGAPGSREAVRRELDHWARAYGVDARLVRALAWMESGFQQDVVSSAGAVGVMQLLPETWEFVDTVLLGFRTPRDYRGNVRAGVRYLRWQLDEFGGDVRLALAGWYQGARAVRERGVDRETREFVRVVLALYGTV
ncbi:MAG: peptidoglycan-binding protein [Thermoleophilia bacterium]|nr:peptidoglycan-binding protein [Gaiellaceae bacterium]MDW8339543.1 peptidoglycan-binding protein [Thermoleophilia bacterium]